jgi:hypothetical protein
LRQLFDFNRAAQVAPGQTVTLLFTVPLDVAASVRPDGSTALRAGRRSRAVRIGFPRQQMLEGSLEVVGGARDVELSPALP